MSLLIPTFELLNNMAMQTNKATQYPKDIKVEHSEELYKMYKIWKNGKIIKTVSEPFYLTDNLEEFIDKYGDCCKKWKVKPNIKYIQLLIKEYNEKNSPQNDANILKSFQSR